MNIQQSICSSMNMELQQTNISSLFFKDLLVSGIGAIHWYSYGL